MNLWESGKSVVLVAGATGTLGRAFCTQISFSLVAGSHLIITSKSEEKLNRLKNELMQANTNIQISAIVWDFSEEANSGKFTKDLQAVLNTFRSFAGQSIKLRPVSRFQSAVLIHAAGAIGDYGQTIQQIGTNTHQLQQIFHINVASLVALVSAYLETFVDNIKNKAIVTMTAPCAENAYASFGYDAISKCAKRMALDVLAKERPDLKILHFNPVAVESPAFFAIRDFTHDAEVRAVFQSISEHKKTYTAEQVAMALVNFLNDFTFESGTVIGTNDLDLANGYMEEKLDQ